MGYRYGGPRYRCGMWDIDMVILDVEMRYSRSVRPVYRYERSCHPAGGNVALARAAPAGVMRTRSRPGLAAATPAAAAAAEENLSLGSFAFYYGHTHTARRVIRWCITRSPRDTMVCNSSNEQRESTMRFMTLQKMGNIHSALLSREHTAASQR